MVLHLQKMHLSIMTPFFIKGHKSASITTDSPSTSPTSSCPTLEVECDNGGTCVLVEGDDFKCLCPMNWTGKYCHEEEGRMNKYYGKICCSFRFDAPPSSLSLCTVPANK